MFKDLDKKRSRYNGESQNDQHVLWASAMTIALPVMAQTAPQQAQPQATTSPVQSVGPDDAAQPSVLDRATPPEGTTASTAQQAQPQTSPTDPSAAQPAQTASQPAASGDQVASVVDQQFATYDKNGDGKLSQAEFGAWMTALKKASDPAAKPDTGYNAAAFAQADKDKSKTVSKGEAAKFLSAGQS